MLEQIEAHRFAAGWDHLATQTCSKQALGEPAGDPFADREMLSRYYAIYFAAVDEPSASKARVGYFHPLAIADENRLHTIINLYYEKPEGFLVADVLREGVRAVVPAGESVETKFAVYGLSLAQFRQLNGGT